MSILRDPPGCCQVTLTLGGPSEARVSDLNFDHPSARSVQPPFAVLDRISRDRRIGPHRCLSFVYVCRPIGGTLTPQLTEVAAARWVRLAEIAQLAPTPDDLPDLVSAAARWAQAQSRPEAQPGRLGPNAVENR